MLLARRVLLQDKLRLLLSVVGVALAIMLVLILGGFISGINQQVGAYLEKQPGSIVVIQAGSQGANSVLPPGTVAAVAAEPGVERSIPVTYQWAILDLKDRKQFAYVIGYDRALGGGPWKLSVGREPSSDSEVVFDSVLAARRGIGVGDGFDLMGRHFTITGLSQGTTSWMASYIFMRNSAADQLYGMRGTSSYLLVTPGAGVSADELRTRLGQLPGVDALAKTELVATQRRIYTSVFITPLELMAGIATLVGALVVGMVVYAATVERQREYGMLKAVGAGNLVLYRVVGAQAVAAAVMGAVMGIGLAQGAGWLIMTLRPQFLITIEPSSVAVALVTGLLMALLAALWPARLIARLAPAEVFRR
jgi:putative ABC transport system permease protein